MTDEASGASTGIPRDACAREAERIVREYERRERELPPGHYGLEDPVNRARHDEYGAVTRAMLAAEGLTDLSSLDILEVGCGTGQWLCDFRTWGAAEGRLCGIDLIDGRAEEARRRCPGADVRVGDASALPWPAERFDVVLQSTVMSSILDGRVRAQVAAEMVRVLRPSGFILWYDFTMDNPSNANVVGMTAREVARLFPSFRASVKRVTLAPPIARRVTPWAPRLAAALGRIPWLRTHIVALLRAPSTTGARG